MRNFYQVLVNTLISNVTTSFLWFALTFWVYLETKSVLATAFMIAPIAEFGIIPFMNSEAGRNAFGWLVGGGEARGIALVFFVAGLIMVIAALLAFLTKSYRRLSNYYATAK